MLTEDDEKFWGPAEAVWGMLLGGIPKEAKVLDVGPGWQPFPRADVSIDFQGPEAFPGVKWPEKYYRCDLASEPLPFKDKSFDFIYCRQVLEDMWNPFHLIREMERVGKSGYIECPSPLIELCNGADGGSPGYKGFHHHHWIVYVEGETLKFITKYPLVEHMTVNEDVLASMLRKTGKYWGTYFLWKDKIPVKHLQNAVDFKMNEEYSTILTQAMLTSIKSTDRFWSQWSLN